MIRLFSLSVAVVATFTAFAHAEPKYFIRDIATLADCHKEYDTLAGGWRHHAWFMRRQLPGGREHVLNCLPDGVEELVCNPATRKLAVAINEGQSQAACRPFTPKLPLGAAMLPG